MRICPACQREVIAMNWHVPGVQAGCCACCNSLLQSQFAYMLDLGDDETFRALYTDALTLDEAIARAAAYLRSNKLDGCRVHIRQDGEYMAEVAYHGWNGGRIEVENYSERPLVCLYELNEDGRRVYPIISE